MKRKIRLTEGMLHRIIENSVKRIIRESDGKTRKYFGGLEDDDYDDEDDEFDYDFDETEPEDDDLKGRLSLGKGEDDDYELDGEDPYSDDDYSYDDLY